MKNTSNFENKVLYMIFFFLNGYKTVFCKTFDDNMDHVTYCLYISHSVT